MVPGYPWDRQESRERDTKEDEQQPGQARQPLLVGVQGDAHKGSCGPHQREKQHKAEHEAESVQSHPKARRGLALGFKEARSCQVGQVARDQR